MNIPKELNPSQRILLGPGPSGVHPRVYRALGTPIVGHLDPEFLTIMDEIQEQLRFVFQTRNRLTLAVSGTGSAGMEAAFVNVIEPGDTVIVGGLCLGSIVGLHLAANHPAKVPGVALFSPTLNINGWAMPWYTKFFSLVRHNWVANLMHFPDAESLGIKCERVRTFVRAALENSDGSEMGTSGVPGVMVLEHCRMVRAAKAILKTIKQPTITGVLRRQR